MVIQAEAFFYSSKAPDVSVKDNFANENSVRVYPNPATDHVMIESAEGFVSIKEIELTNMLGQKIKFEKVNKHMCELQMADVPEGIYFIRITQQLNEQTFITTKKIIKR
ncbi:MAG: T9SS type A sorting domain-containing protein [Sphingobacteriaceae bacterium]|nr:T9SS type A sorting domain-containing protein [Sphingobacteriaceae bacterium]